MAQTPRISFGIIVLNGEPFTKYCLRQVYPHAHQIIVVEGGTDKTAGITSDGHSTDGTLKALEEFKAEEDPEGKVTIVKRSGHWSEKDEQSRAYAELATGDYLWQVDVDEFYRHEDIVKVKEMLASDPSIDAVSFAELTFWGSPSILVDSFKLRSDKWDEYHRLFKWRPGYRYTKHRPPTVTDESGVDLRRKRWVDGSDSKRLGVFLYHFSLLFPIQVRNKCQYYATPSKTTNHAYMPGIIKWAEEGYFKIKRPFRVYNVYTTVSWLKRYIGPIPEEAERMWLEASQGRLGVEVRENSDAEKLLNNRAYRFAALLLYLMAETLRHQPFHSGRWFYLAVMGRLRRGPRL